MNPIYANIVKVRASATELIIEFGCFIPDTDSEKPQISPEDVEPSVRVILGIQGARPLADMLMKVWSAHSSPAAAVNKTLEPEDGDDQAPHSAAQR